MTDDLIARARAALDGVTAGPWETVLLDTDGREFDRGKFRVLRGAYFGHSVGPRGKHLFLAPYSQTDDDADARFIAAARDLVPALVDEVEQYRVDLEEFRRDLESAEAKVAKLVEALRRINSTTETSFPGATSATDVTEIQRIARATLAEIEGGQK